MKLITKLTFSVFVLIVAFLAQIGDAHACAFPSDYNSCIMAVAQDNTQCLGSGADQYFCHALASDKVCRCYAEFCNPLGICIQGPID